MNFLISIWRHLNLLSLDVVFGAMAGMFFFADLLDVSLPSALYLVLAMAVWGMYSMDHLIDAKKITHLASSERHRFHQRYFVLLIILLALVTLTGLVMVILFEKLQFMLFPGIIFAGIMLFWMGLLLLFEKKIAWLKEISTAFFYVSGISLAPFLSHFPNEIPKEFYFIFVAYILLAAINLYILSYIDEKYDARDDLGSALQLLSKIALGRFILLLSIGTIIYLVAAFILVPSYYRIHCSILLIVTLFHILEFYKKNKKNIRKKLEASFLLPWVLLIL